MPDIIQQLKFMWGGGDTLRYHTYRTIMEDRVGGHSYNVACIIMAVRPDASAKLLRAALKHDMAEHITGDMPAPTKRLLPDYTIGWPGEPSASSTSFRDIYGGMEQSVAAQHGVDLEEEGLTDDERFILKCADSLDGMRFCIMERAMGNGRIEPVYRNFESYVKKLLDENRSTPNDPERLVFESLGYDWDYLNDA